MYFGHQRDVCSELPIRGAGDFFYCCFVSIVSTLISLILYHPLSSSVILSHPLSSSLILSHPLFILYHPISSTGFLFHPLSSSLIHSNPILSFVMIYHPFSSSLILREPCTFADISEILIFGEEGFKLLACLAM